MRPWICFLLLFPIAVSGQTDYDMDELARNTPGSATASVETLGRYFKSKAPDDRGRVRAIYAWITLNIRYQDIGNATQLWATPEHLEKQRPVAVLRNRSAVCQGIANTFQALCTVAGIDCQVVPGLVKDYGGDVLPVGHAWVAARIQGQWRLFDPTWSLRRPGNNWDVDSEFFMVPPEQFVLNHLPDDPVWQLLENPVTETEFREHDRDALAARLRVASDEPFRFRDTLQQWISLDSLSRTLAAESRVLRFNGSNERVLFGLGQNYWVLFYDLRSKLDSLADRSILYDSVFLDPSYYTAQLNLLEVYHRRARELFSRITDPRRLAMTERFYTETDVAGIIGQLRGSMWAAIFENRLGSSTQQLDEASLRELAILADSTERIYQYALGLTDCRKLRNQCYEIWHNLSLIHLQLAEQYGMFVQKLLASDKAQEYLALTENQIAAANGYFKKAESETRQLQRIPPPYAFVLDRLQSTLQGQHTMQVQQLRLRRMGMNKSIESAINTGNFPQKLLSRVRELTSDLDDLIQVTEDGVSTLGDEYCDVTLFNLHQEKYAAAFNLGNLYLRAAIDQQAGKRGSEEGVKQLKDLGSSALANAREASQSLLYLKQQNRLDKTTLANKESALAKLSNTIREFLSTLP